MLLSNCSRSWWVALYYGKRPVSEGIVTKLGIFAQFNWKHKRTGRIGAEWGTNIWLFALNEPEWLCRIELLFRVSRERKRAEAFEIIQVDILARTAAKIYFRLKVLNLHFEGVMCLVLFSFICLPKFRNEKMRLVPISKLIFEILYEKYALN